MFASTHPQGFPPAILSRLQRFDVRRLTQEEITGKLERILQADGREADPAAVQVVARLAAGPPASVPADYWRLGRPAEPSPYARSAGAAVRLWRLSETLCGADFL